MQTRINHKPKRFKLKRVLIFACVLLLNSSCIRVMGEPLKRADNSARSDLVPRDEALQQVYRMLVVATANCPEFCSADYNRNAIWAMIGISECYSYGKDDTSDFIYGCADSDFVDRAGLASCIAAILLIKDACDHPSGRPLGGGPDPGLARANSLSYSICANVLKSRDRDTPLFF